MTRAERLKKAVRHSGVTADSIILDFEDISHKKNIELPTSPVTISRHLNGKRAFGIEEAEAYAEAMDVDPAGILFSPVIKNIKGNVDLVTQKITWNDLSEEILSIRVPREFFHKRYRVIQNSNIQESYYGTINIYEKIENNKIIDPLLFNHLAAIKTINKNKEQWWLGIAKPTSKKKCMILNYSGQILKENVEILKIYPIVANILPLFWRHYPDEYK